MRVLLVSTYELGHQPLHVASPAAALRKAGHEVRCLDLSVERWDAGALEWAQAAGFSVPMHTAMRLAMRAAAGVRRARPELPVCFYGLYAPVSRDLTVDALGRPRDRRRVRAGADGLGRRAGGRSSPRGREKCSSYSLAAARTPRSQQTSS